MPAVPVLQNKLPVQKVAEEEEPLQAKFTAQLKSPEEEELPLQGKFTTQKKEPDEDELPVQGKFIFSETAREQTAVQRFIPQNQPIQKKENKTGLPDNLKEGVENLSGIAMDDVRVHYNSDKPAELNALAYAQGTDIHVGAGQEKHLPHEAWHIAQQKQGRVKPTMQMKEGVAVNDDKGLENEADVMGGKALQMRTEIPLQPTNQKVVKGEGKVIQALLQGTNFNLVAQEFRQGLIHGHYRPPNNLADMHVDQANEQNPHATSADLLVVMQDIYQAMNANYIATDATGTLDWRPTGSAVVKMVVELLGEALGGTWSKYKARAHKAKRKIAGHEPEEGRDEMVLSKDVVPEHMAYLASLQGGDTSFKTVLPGDYRRKMQAFLDDNPHSTQVEQQEFQRALEAEQEQNILEDSDAGKMRLAQYRQSLEEGGNTMETGGNPVSLNVQLKHTQLPAIIGVLQSL